MGMYRIEKSKHMKAAPGRFLSLWIVAIMLLCLCGCTLRRDNDIKSGPNDDRAVESDIATDENIEPYEAEVDESADDPLPVESSDGSGAEPDSVVTSEPEPTDKPVQDIDSYEKPEQVTDTPTVTPLPAEEPVVTETPAHTPVPTETPTPEPTPLISKGFDLSEVPDFSGRPYYKVNNDIPFFTEDMLTTDFYESYGELDSLGRCTSCIACIGEECMPTESRGPIGQIKPSGWHTVKYQGIDGNYLYNRCHLIGYQLTAENANPRNLITGTRYMNVQGMLYWEDITAWYITSTGNHVLYRSTPIFVGDELVARGVLIEAISVEDNGAGIKFCEFCYNVQPGVTIDYATGESEGEEFVGSTVTSVPSVDPKITETPTMPAVPDDSGKVTYILNRRSKKFHLPGCSGVASMAEHNKQEFYGTREEAIAQGYSPCGSCKP